MGEIGEVAFRVPADHGINLACALLVIMRRADGTRVLADKIGVGHQTGTNQGGVGMIYGAGQATTAEREKMDAGPGRFKNLPAGTAAEKKPLTLLQAFESLTGFQLSSDHGQYQIRNQSRP